MALPGTPGQRISDLCNGNHITQKELAEKIGVSASQLSRIVSGETRTVSSDILIGVAKEFKVSTDYILGLSTVSVRKSYDISELGLSEGAVRGLVTGAVDVQILNRLLEHRNFPKLIDLIRIYFQDTAAKGITARNQLIEIATASLSDLMKEHPEHRAEAKQDLQLLNAQKMGEHEAEIEKIKNVFLAILRDIKKDIDNGEQPGEAVTAAMFQAMRDALAEQKQNPLSIDDVATSSMESGFCFCSANASRMAWNIAAVTASPGCSPLSMSFLISRRIARNTFLIFSISASCSPIFWAFKSCKSCFASARCSGCSFIRSDREAVAISISWFLAVMPFAAVS